MMKFEEMTFSLNTMHWMVLAAISIVLWMVRRNAASSAEVAAVNAEVVSLRERVVALEVDMKNMPSEITVRELIAQLASLTAYQEANKEQLNQMQHSVNRLHDFLLKKG